MFSTIWKGAEGEPDTWVGVLEGSISVTGCECTADLVPQMWPIGTRSRLWEPHKTLLRHCSSWTLHYQGIFYSTLSTPCTPFGKNKYNIYSTTVDSPNTSFEVFSFPEALQPWCSTLTFSELNCSAQEFVTPALFSWLSWDLPSLQHKERCYLSITMCFSTHVNITPCQNCIAQVEQEVGHNVLPHCRKIVWVS